MSKKNKKIDYGLALSYIAISLIMFFFLAPFVWIVISSIQPKGLLASVPLRIDLSRVTLENYKNLFTEKEFINAAKSTILVTLGTTILGLLFSSIGAYVVASFDFPGRNAFAFTCLSMQLAPAITFLIPIFLLLQWIRLLDTYTGLIGVFLVFICPVSMWIMVGFFKSIPADFAEAAYIDGCSHFKAFCKIVSPLVIPGFIAAGVIIFISVWGDLLIPLVVSLSKTNTLTVFASSLSGAHSVDYGGAAAVSVISGFPTVILALLFRKYLIRGLVEGGIKG